MYPSFVPPEPSEPGIPSLGWWIRIRGRPKTSCLLHYQSPKPSYTYALAVVQHSSEPMATLCTHKAPVSHPGQMETQKESQNSSKPF